MGVVRISVISDVVCPWCFIGKRRLERALAERPDETFDVAWRPYELHPYLPPEGIPRDELIARKFGGGARARAVFERIGDAGKEEGIAFDFDSMAHIPNTLAAHCALSWALEDSSDTQNALAEALFSALFEHGRDIGDHAILADVCGSVGMATDDVRAKLDAARDREAIQREAEKNRGRGVMGVPHFVVEDRFPIPGAQTPDTMLHVIDTAIARR